VVGTVIGDMVGAVVGAVGLWGSFPQANRLRQHAPASSNTHILFIQSLLFC